MIRNRVLRETLAGIIASIVALFVTLTVGLMWLYLFMVMVMPPSDWSGVLFGGLLLAVFSAAFVIVFREMRDKLAGL